MVAMKSQTADSKKFKLVTADLFDLIVRQKEEPIISSGSMHMMTGISLAYPDRLFLQGVYRLLYKRQDAYTKSHDAPARKQGLATRDYTDICV